jgi:pyridoxal phosphate enzyme (YggS family)
MELTSIEERILDVRQSLPPGVELVAVSKTRSAEEVKEAMGVGQVDFGENRVQELVEKAADLPATLRWHQIGTLQRNKVKQVVPFVHLIHSVDSLPLLEEISKKAVACGREVSVLMQVHVALEETKHGFTPDELRAFCDAEPDHPGVRIAGIMGMASNTDSRSLVLHEFQKLRAIYEELGDSCDASWKTLSMGMSSDWRLAVDCGSTLVRVGSAIFGSRDEQE